MILDLTEQITNAQIAFFLGVIAVVLVWRFLVKKPTRRK